MKPLSAFNYIRANRGRSALVIFMLFLTIMATIAGNYIASVDWYWAKAIEYDKEAVLISGLSVDEGFADYGSVIEDLEADEDLTILHRSSYGYSGIAWTCTMGFEMGSSSFVFDNADDMKAFFDHVGVECDYSNIHDGSVVMSCALANNKGLELGDIVDYSVDHNITGEYTLDAIIDDDSFIVFYVEHSAKNYRAYVMSDTMSGDELRDHIRSVIGERKVKVERSMEEELMEELSIFYVMFYLGVVLLSLMLAVTVNSVLTGHYIKRTYEFGVLRAIGLTKRNIRNKVFCEIMAMDIIAIVLGAAVVLLVTFLLNELLYLPKGQYLPYISDMGLAGAALSNLTVIVPTIILKGRKMTKADVTEF